MTLNDLGYYLFGFTSILYIIHLGFYIVGASLYDILQERRRYALRTEQRKQLIYPHVTVLIPAHNEEVVIARCIDSVLRNTYANLDIVVVSDASTDRTGEIVRSYKHPGIRFVSTPMHSGKGAALNYALARYVEGELVMTLDADSTIDAHAIKNAVAYFMDPRVVGVAANIQIINQHTPLSIIQKFEHLISYRSKKAYSLTNCEFVIGGVASTYRMSTLREVGFYDTDTLTEDIGLSIKIVSRGNKQHKLVYGSDVLATTEPVLTFGSLLKQRFRWKYGSIQNILKYGELLDKNDSRFTNMLTTYRLPLAIIMEFALLLLPVVWLYALYITFAEHSVLLIVGAYLTIAIYTLQALFQDEHIRWREKLSLSIYAPVIYFMFYVMDCVQILAVFGCLFKLGDLLRKRNIGSIWTSPTRVGEALTPATVVHAEVIARTRRNSR